MTKKIHIYKGIIYWTLKWEKLLRAAESFVIIIQAVETIAENPRYGSKEALDNRADTQHPNSSICKRTPCRRPKGNPPPFHDTWQSLDTACLLLIMPFTIIYIQGFSCVCTKTFSNVCGVLINIIRPTSEKIIDRVLYQSKWGIIKKYNPTKTPVRGHHASSHAAHLQKKIKKGGIDSRTKNVRQQWCIGFSPEPFAPWAKRRRKQKKRGGRQQ